MSISCYCIIRVLVVSRKMSNQLPVFADWSNANAFMEMNYDEQKEEAKDVRSHNELMTDYMRYCDDWHYQNDYEPSRALQVLLKELMSSELSGDEYNILDDEIRILNMGCGRNIDHHDDLLFELFAVSDIVNADIYKHDSSVHLIDPSDFGIDLFALQINMLSVYPNSVNDIVRARQSYDALEEGGIIICCNLETSQTDTLEGFAQELEKLGMRTIVYRLFELDDQPHIVYVGSKVCFFSIYHHLLLLIITL